MTQNTTSATGFGRPRVRRGLGLLVGVTVALTPVAIAPAATPAATSAKHSAQHVLRADYRSNNLLLRLLGGGGGRGYGPVDGLGSLLSRILDPIADLLGDGSRGPGPRR